MKRLWKVTADLVSGTLYVTQADGESTAFPLYGLEAFRVLSDLWIKSGWASRYSYNFSWMGRPVIQLPEDLFMVQEVIYRVRPDVIVETGVAHGGSAVFYASLLELLGRGRVISIDIEIRPHNRRALDQHPLRHRISLLEGNSVALETVQEVRRMVGAGEKVMAILDSNHSKAHVLQELELYSALIAPGSYIVVADGNMEDLQDVPGGSQKWLTDNPRVAIHEFLGTHPEFEIDPEPTRLGVTYWPEAYLRRK